MKKLFALVLFLLASGILRADTLTVSSTQTIDAGATFTLHSDGAPSFATITGFANIAAIFSFPIYDPSPITPSGHSAITINSVTLNYSITPTGFSSFHNPPVLSDCFLGELTVDCSTLAAPTFNNASPLAIDPNVSFRFGGVASDIETATSLSGSIVLSPTSDWAFFLTAPGAPVRVATQLDLLPPSDPGSLLKTPGGYETAITSYLVDQQFSESLSFTIDYTLPVVPPSPVPEPGSLLLLGSGLFVGARSAIARRAFLNKNQKMRLP